jgi:hypothetical protein
MLHLADSMEREISIAQFDSFESVPGSLAPPGFKEAYSFSSEANVSGGVPSILSSYITQRLRESRPKYPRKLDPIGEMHSAYLYLTTLNFSTKRTQIINMITLLSIVFKSYHRSIALRA